MRDPMAAPNWPSILSVSIVVSSLLAGLLQYPTWSDDGNISIAAIGYSNIPSNIPKCLLCIPLYGNKLEVAAAVSVPDPLW